MKKLLSPYPQLKKLITKQLNIEYVIPNNGIPKEFIQPHNNKFFYTTFIEISEKSPFFLEKRFEPIHSSFIAFDACQKTNILKLGIPEKPTNSYIFEGEMVFKNWLEPSIEKLKNNEELMPKINLGAKIIGMKRENLGILYFNNCFLKDIDLISTYVEDEYLFTVLTLEFD